MATLDINGVELLAKYATVRPAELTDKVFLGSGNPNFEEARWMVSTKSLANSLKKKNLRVWQTLKRR